MCGVSKRSDVIILKQNLNNFVSTTVFWQFEETIILLACQFLTFLADKIMQTMPCIVHIVINLGFLPMGYGEITSPQSSHLWIPDRLFHISAVSRGFKIKPDPAALGSCSVKYDMNPPFEVEVSWNFGNHSHPLQIL